MSTAAQRRIQEALKRIDQSGGVDGAHHKQWVLDQTVRILTGCPSVTAWAVDRRGERYSYTTLEANDRYKAWVQARIKDGYEWDEGIPP